MRVDLFDFDLPERAIALRPARPRDAARLLVVEPAGPFEDRLVSALPDLLRAGDVLVLNDARVIPARLSGVRERGAAVPVEATLHQRLGPAVWTAFAKPGKRLRAGDTLVLSGGALRADILEKREGGEIVLGFDRAGAALDAAIAAIGAMPLPPYIAAKRAPDAEDGADYQTVYARTDGAVAAPTAGLHFTPSLLGALKARGVDLHTVTLHVGAGTFLPVKADDTGGHRMHAERRVLSAETAEALNAARAARRRVIAVGTTALRTLESAVDAEGRLLPCEGDTDLFITPGYRFRAVDGLLTNFHLPRSTLFMLVCAFSGQARMQAAYAHAIASGYRFYSYGDACLLWAQAGLGDPS